MKKFRILFLLLPFFPLNLFAQDFSPAYPLVDMPGDNIEMDVLSPRDPFAYPQISTYLSWINKKDSLYSVYLARLDSSLGVQILIKGDSIEKSNTQIVNLSDEAGIRVMWQEHTDSVWKIVYSDYFFNDSIGVESILQDSLKGNPQITMNLKYCVWVDGGNLFSIDFEKTDPTPQIIDFSLCSNPDLLFGSSLYSGNAILYEKEINGEKQIFYADQDYSSPGVWQHEQISSNGSNINPKFGILGEIAFQNQINNFSRILFSFGDPEFFDSTMNTTINFEHPRVFSYPVVTKNYTPFFIALDTDSLPDNKEIFLKILIWDNHDSLINISDSEGDDFSPEITFINYRDSSELGLLWYKRIDNKTDIWMSKTIFNPNWGAISEGEQIPVIFNLQQNYPNPFNPSTTIEYFVARPGNLELTLFDVSGKKIRALFKGFKSRGYFKTVFKAGDLSSGVYFYRMSMGRTSVTKKMLLIR